MAGILKLLDPVFPAAALVIVMAGAFMAGDVSLFEWDQAWISVGAGRLVFVLALGGVALSRTVRSLNAAARDIPEGPVPAAFRLRLLDPVMFAAENTVSLVLVALVYMMVDKPNLAGALGPCWGRPCWGRGR